MTRHCLLLTLLVAIAACGSSEATDILGVTAAVNALGGQVEAHVSQPGRNTTFTNAQLLSATGSTPLLVSTAKSGKMQVRFTVITSPADTIATAEIELSLHKGYVYSADAFRQPAGAGYGCFGCSGYAKFPFRGSQRNTTDSLWIYYSAAPPLCKGCVY